MLQYFSNIMITPLGIVFKVQGKPFKEIEIELPKSADSQLTFQLH